MYYKLFHSLQAQLIFTVILSLNIFAHEHKFIKLADGLQFPEGPAWDGKGNLFVSSCYGGYITKISKDGSSTFVDSINHKPLKQTNGLTFGNDGYLYACDYGIGAILKVSPAGVIEIHASNFNGEKFNRPNDLAFDRNGNLYFTDPKSYGEDKLDGRIFRIDKETQEVILAASDLAFPNGIAFSADGEFLYVAESAKSRILKFKVEEDGMLKMMSVFVELPGGDPDGLAFDIEGNLYAAHFGGGNIYVINPNGEIISKIQTPGKKPSNVEFGGEDFKTLFITEDETNAVYMTQISIPGLKLHYSPMKGIE